jgi:hypothetical protein
MEDKFMSFQEMPLEEVPHGTPDVQIFFHGQLLLRSPEEQGQTCVVAVNPLALNHVFTIEARTKVPGRPDTIRMRHVGPLLLRHEGDGLIEGMSITVLGTEDDPVTPAAFKCVKKGEPIDYTSGASNPPDEDFRWILNLEGPQFHERSLKAPIFNSHHTVKLQGGQYFFRTAVRAPAAMGHRRKGGGKSPVTFRRIGVIASASVFLTGDQSVTLAWQATTKEGDFTLTLHREENTTHEIYINNAPLYLDRPPSPDDPSSGELPLFDELPDYYKLIRNVAEEDRFQLIPTILVDTRGDEGSPDIPCQVQRLDGPGD